MDSTRFHQGTPQGFQTLILDDMMMKSYGVSMGLVLTIRTLIGEVHSLKTTCEASCLIQRLWLKGMLHVTVIKEDLVLRLDFSSGSPLCLVPSPWLDHALLEPISSDHLKYMVQSWFVFICSLVMNPLHTILNALVF